MSRRRVAWDGPMPQPGDYLENCSAETLWLIVEVEPLRRPDPSGARIALDVQTVPRAGLPLKAIVHPWSRAAPADTSGPDRVRQVVHPGSAAAVMRASWRDPADMRPSAAQDAREVSGWHTFCPLRRMQAGRGSSVTERHVAAASILRQHFDLARYGRTGGDMVLPIGATAFGPRSGPSVAAHAQSTASREVARVLRRFTLEQQVMLFWVVLSNQTIAAWCLGDRTRNADREMGRLLAVLDLLADHFASEVDAALAADRPVRAA